MSVRRKPKTVVDFIQAGGIDPAEKKVSDTLEASIQPVKLRLPQALLNQIDDAVAERRPAPSRHQWILEAIYEKLQRDS